MVSTLRFDKWENDTGSKSVNINQVAGGGGLVPVTPTSISVGSGTATVSGNNKINFTAVSSLNLNNIFTNTYDNYRVMINFSSFTANHDMFLRLRSSGADASGTNYFYAGNAMNTASTNGSWVANSATAFHLGTNASIYANRSRNFIEFWDPAIATNTKAFWNSFHDNGSTWNHTAVSGAHLLTNIYDGLTLFPSAGTMTGSINIYGYNQ
jgi:hypothetical protein